MTDIFTFPSHFKTDVHMGVENFIANGNLTETGRKKLLNCLMDVSVLYGISCQDRSEIVVLGIEFDYQDGAVSKDYVSTVLSTVASALPYRSMIYAERKGRARIYSFDGHINQQDNCRMVITKCHSTITFNPSKLPESIKKYIEHTTYAVQKYSNADEVNKWWNIYLKDDMDGVDEIRAKENF